MTDQEFRMLGKIVYHQNPKLARNIIDSMQHLIPQQTDHSLIQQYFQTFMNEKGLTYDMIKSARKNEKTYVNRQLKIFLAAMLHIYTPELFFIPKFYNLPQGFIKHLCIATQQTKAKLSADVKTVIMHIAIYGDFKSAVHSFLYSINQKIIT